MSKAKKDETESQAPSTTSVLYAPEGITGCSYNGVEYTVSEEGTVEVVNEAVNSLVEHGFTTSKPKA
jgi:hypothetical protein